MTGLEALSISDENIPMSCMSNAFILCQVVSDCLCSRLVCAIVQAGLAPFAAWLFVFGNAKLQIILHFINQFANFVRHFGKKIKHKNNEHNFQKGFDLFHSPCMYCGAGLSQCKEHKRTCGVQEAQGVS